MPNGNPVVAELVERMLQCGAVSIRDVDAGEEPFLYSSGNRGPGYVMMKGLVSQRKLLTDLVRNLAHKVYARFPDVEYVAGNATGGMIPGWIMAEQLSRITGRHVPYVYVRNTRKIGGHGESITGDKQNAFFSSKRRGLVVEELVNFAETTVNSASVQRDAGHTVQYAATILFYDNLKSHLSLTNSGVKLISLMTLAELLTVIRDKRLLEPHLVDSYMSFLADPVGWQKFRNLLPKE